MTFYTSLNTPVGQLKIVSDGAGITAVRFTDAPLTGEKPDAISRLAKQQLQEYFQGQRRVFDIPLAPQGTPFQRQVWRSLCDIPYGETTCYQHIATAISNPRAVRAVGAANGKNPVAVIIPCHRVIGKDGSLTGYAGGLERKSWLLALEQ